MDNFFSIIAYTSSSSSGSAATSAAFGVFSGIYMLFMCLYCLFFLYIIFGIIISAISLVDVANRTKEEIPDKTMWVLLIYPFGSYMLFIPAMIYFFTKKRKMDALKK